MVSPIEEVRVERQNIFLFVLIGSHLVGSGGKTNRYAKSIFSLELLSAKMKHIYTRSMKILWFIVSYLILTLLTKLRHHTYFSY